MVKGVTRQVILVEPTDRQRFEKAIFILRDGGRESAEELLQQAREIAAGAMGAGRTPRRLPGWAYLLAGAACMGAVWLAVSLI